MRNASILSLLILACVAVQAADELRIDYTLPRAGNVSLAIYDAQGHQVRNLLAGDAQTVGKHSTTWDGLDRVGAALPPGSYTWKLLMNNGLESDFITVIGQNVADPAQPWTPTVGNHQGPSSVACGADGSVYLGSRNGEGPPVLIKHAAKPGPELWNWWWQTPGPVDMIDSGKTLFVITWNNYLHFIDPATGKGQGEGIDLLWTDDKRGGVDDPIGNHGLSLSVANGQPIVAWRHHNALRWFDQTSRKMVREQAVEQPRAVAAGANGIVYVLSGTRVVAIATDGKQNVIVEKGVLADLATLDFDTVNQQIIVADGGTDQRIRRFALDGKPKGAYGRLGGRLDGVFVASDFKNVIRLRCDGQGGFFLVEFEGIRRIMHCASDGKVLKEWYGGTPFYSVASADPTAPTELWYNASDTYLAMAKVDLDTGAWKIGKAYSMEGVGEGLFPGVNTFPLWRVRKLAGQTYFYHESPPAIVRVDEAKQKLVPVALATHKSKQWGYTSFPSPTINAALAAKKLTYDSQDCDNFTWSDLNGNGALDADEFRFSPTGVGCNGYAGFDDQFNVYFGFCAANNYNWTGSRWMDFDFQGSAYVKLPNRAAKGSTTPLWDWSTIERSVAKVPADLADKALNFGSSARWDARGGVTLTMMGDLLDRDGPQWPNGQSGKTALLRAMPDSVAWVASKKMSVGMTGGAMLGYPVNSPGAVHGCTITCDRNTFGASAWTEDGLFAGTFLDRHVNDLPDWAYGGSRGMNGLFAGDDWECAGSMTDMPDGSVLWMPRCAFGRISVLRVRGWDNWVRSEGKLTIAKPAPAAGGDGTGLAACYVRGTDLAAKPLLERTDALMWFRQADAEPRFVSWKAGPCAGITAAEPFGIRWSGRLVAPRSEDYWFRIKNEELVTSFVTTQWWKDGAAFVRVWLNDVLIIDRGQDALAGGPFDTGPFRLQAGQSYALRIDYVSPGNPKPEFSLSWASNTIGFQRIPGTYLYPDQPTAGPVVRLAVAPGAAPAFDITIDKPTSTALPIAYRLLGLDRVTQPALQAVIPAGKKTLRVALPKANGPQTVTLLPSLPYRGDGSEGRLIVGGLYMPEGLLSLYPFDEREGNSAHDCVGRIESPFNGFLSPPQPRWLTKDGKLDGCLELAEAGTDQHLKVLLKSEFSLGFWVRTKRPTSALMVGPSACDFWLDNGQVREVMGGWGMDYTPHPTVADGAWHHVGFTWNWKPGGDAPRVTRLFVDGVQTGVGGGPGQAAELPADKPKPETPGFSDVHLGNTNNLPGETKLFIGAFDDLRTYGRCLSADEMKQLATPK